MPEILSAQLDKGSSTFDMPTFCHAGETHDMNVTNLHDAMLLNTKRIGHGFQLFLFPNLVDECIKKDVCVEVCPLSNMVLGYTFDLRTHPIRDLTHKGLQFSISSDDPGFFDYEGVTLDYAYATLAWELNLRDLKKLSLNGITYSSIS
jgi:adenosine deaminase CECR1